MFHLDRVSLVVAVTELQFVSESVPQPAPPIVEDAKSADLLSDRNVPSFLSNRTFYTLVIFFIRTIFIRNKAEILQIYYIELRTPC